MPNPIVTLTRCSDYSRPGIAEAIERHFNLLGGLKQFVKPGDSVLLKPNFIAPRARRYAAQTDPAVILETARLLKDFGARPFVADSPAWSNTFACVKALKLDEPLKQLSVPVKQLVCIYVKDIETRNARCIERTRECSHARSLLDHGV